MGFYIDFNGNKIGDLEFSSYEEARIAIIKIVKQCMNSFRQSSKNKSLKRIRENDLRSKIFAKLKISYSTSHFSSTHLFAPKMPMALIYNRPTPTPIYR